MSDDKLPDGLKPRYQRPIMNRAIWEALETKALPLLIADYMHNYSTVREQFIYNNLLRLQELVQDAQYVYNYPGGKVTRQTYYKHKRWLTAKFQAMTIKAAAPHVEMIKAE